MYVLKNNCALLFVYPIQSGRQLEVAALWQLLLGSRKAGQFQLAERLVGQIRSKLGLLTSVVSETVERLGHERLKLEEARLFWARGEGNVALGIMQGLIKDIGGYL